MRIRVMGMSAILLFLLTACFAQNRETRKLDSFDEVSVSEGIDLYLKKGDMEGAVLEVSGLDTENVLTKVSGGKLKVYIDGNKSWFKKVDAKVYVTFKNLSSISASSAANVICQSDVEAESLDLSASSAASMEVRVQANKVNASASSSGDISISGKAEALEASASSAGDIDAFDLECETAEVRASSAGDIKLKVTNRIDARASSGADIRYKGDPAKSNVSSSSGGSVKKY